MDKPGAISIAPEASFSDASDIVSISLHDGPSLDEQAQNAKRTSST